MRSSAPDCPHNEWNRVAEFNLSTSAGLTRQGRVFASEMSRRLAVLDLTKRVLRRGAWTDSAPPPPRPDSLTRLVVSTFLSNVELLKTLGAHYQFKPLAYWQPTVFQKPRLTKYERAERAKEPLIGAFFQKTYARLKASHHEGLVHDLSDVFADWRAANSGGTSPTVTGPKSTTASPPKAPLRVPPRAERWTMWCRGPSSNCRDSRISPALEAVTRSGWILTTYRALPSSWALT